MFPLTWHNMISSEDEDSGVTEGNDEDVQRIGQVHQKSKMESRVSLKGTQLYGINLERLERGMFVRGPNDLLT